ncbi:MAG: hypothetical protein ACTH9H_13635 [Galactobacter sp.]
MHFPWTRLAVPVAAVLLLASCSSADGSTDPGTIRGSFEFDYDIQSTLTDLAGIEDVVVVGEVTDWVEGRSIVDGDDAERFAVLTVQVQTAAKTLTADQAKTVYVSVSRGVEGLDASGEPDVAEGQGSTVLTMKELKAAAPAGTRVIVAGVENPSPQEEAFSPEVNVEDPRAGLPEGATLVALHPQGLIFELPGGGFTSGMAQDDDLDSIAKAAAAASQSDATTPGAKGSFANLVSELKSFESQVAD